MVYVVKMKGFKGIVFYNKRKKCGLRYDFGKTRNLLVDDGHEYILDFFAGLKSWHSPAAAGSGAVGLLTYVRQGGLGLCMFNNASEERVAGTNGIPSGSCSYPTLSTVLVSPEDSTLSNEVGSRVALTARRVDQTVEFYGKFEVPGDLPAGSRIREFGLFLQATGPTADPSFIDAEKPSAMLCRTALWGSGVCGTTGVYIDSPLIATDDIEIRWKFGEI